MDKQTMVEIIKLTRSADEGPNSAHEKLREIRAIVEAEIRGADSIPEEETALD